MIDYILVSLGFLGLFIGTITDFQKREVADWLNYSLIFSGIGIRLLHSITSNDYYFTLIPMLYLVLMYLFGLGLYKTGQWGGGDSKMLNGLAALFATYSLTSTKLPDFIQGLFNTSLPYNLSFLLHFMVNTLVVGSIYGVLASVYKSIKFRKQFQKQFRKEYAHSKKKTYLAILASFAIASMIPLVHPNLSFMLISFSIMIFVIPWIFIYIKAVEEGCMIQPMKTKDLTEGEWVQGEVRVKGKLICCQKDLGISNDQIALLKKHKIPHVMVKIGIPFVPAFFISFLITIIWGNLFLYLI